MLFVFPANGANEVAAKQRHTRAAAPLGGDALVHAVLAKQFTMAMTSTLVSCSSSYRNAAFNHGCTIRNPPRWACHTKSSTSCHISIRTQTLTTPEEPSPIAPIIFRSLASVSHQIRTARAPQDFRSTRTLRLPQHAQGA